MQRIAVEDRRTALLTAALRVIGREGMGAASTRAVAAEAGMPTASFHYVFASYDDMVEQLVGTILDAQQEGVAAAVDRVADSVAAGLVVAIVVTVGLRLLAVHRGLSTLPTTEARARRARRRGAPDAEREREAPEAG